MTLDFDAESMRRRAHNNYETGRFFNSLVTPYAHAMMLEQDRCVKCGMTAEQIEDQGMSVCSVEY